MYDQTSQVKLHFRETEELIRSVPPDEVARWLLQHGYFPESNILPPTFVSEEFHLQKKRYNKDPKSLTRRKLISISYPKTLLSSREFSIQHPWNYHDVVFELHKEWGRVLDILYSPDLRIYSYSLPLPLTKSKSRNLSNLRAGRMIYEWIKMAENDLVLDSTRFSLIAKTDISNFYSSIYTHSIAWALEGREEAFKDKDFVLPGCIIDRLIQYANDARTNGIPVGSALSDLISELVLCDIDARVSRKLKSLDFLAVRFKDDYRILCQTESEAQRVLSTLASELSNINLVLNERKTSITSLPHGLYRVHDRRYFPHSLREKTTISFKAFEHTLLIALDIHRDYPGTSILEKFLSEILTKKNKLKLRFSKFEERKVRELKKFISLLFLAKRESEKILSHVLALIELIYINNLDYKDELKPYLKDILSKEISDAAEKESAFEVVWYVFFSRYLGLGITNFGKLLGDTPIKQNEFVQSILTSQNKLYNEVNISLFRKPAECKGVLLVDRLDVFQKNAHT